MTDMKVEDGHGVLAPAHDTGPLEYAAGIGDPHLLAERTRDRGLFIGRRCGPLRWHAPLVFLVYLAHLLQTRHHHEAKHSEEEDRSVEEQASRGRSTHRLRYAK